MMTCQTFFEMLKIPTLLTKNWETLQTPKSKIEVRKESFFYQILHPLTSSRWGGINGGIFEEKPSASLHPFGRWGCHLGKFSGIRWGCHHQLEFVHIVCISCVCVCVYMCIYIYTVYTDTPHESTKNMYISDIRFLLLAATSANLQSWNMLFVFPIISCTKERQNIGSRSLWVLSGLSIKN